MQVYRTLHSNEKVTIDSGTVFQDKLGMFQRLHSSRVDRESSDPARKEANSLWHLLVLGSSKK